MDNQPAKRIENSSKSDRISDLPSNIIDNILVCLPIHEAVKTSILSKNWRCKWRYIPKLVFDDTFYEMSVWPSVEEPNIAKLFLNVLRVLLLHHGSIFNFTFNIPLLENSSEIDIVMLYLTKKGVHEIVFDFGEDGYEIHRLPSTLFSCVTLRSLTLSSCIFTVPLAFQGFVKLISLKFEYVRFETNVIETFISKCPSLETLSIKHCYNVGNLDIDIPYLKFFQFAGSFKAICFRKTSPHLSTVVFDEDFDGPYPSEPTKLFECLSVVEHLRLGCIALDYLFYGRKPMKLSLGCLRVLELPEIRFWCARNIFAVLCLIVNSPNLEKLEMGSLGASEDIDPLAPELLKVQDLLHNALKKLRVVKMNFAESRVEQLKPELDFIKFLLAESVVLEKMYMQPDEARVRGDGQKILKEVLRFQCSSKKAKIVVLKS
ncbi:F-box/FBD/LRR-repeat protein At1g13570-like [Mercurialis annua]|uniref:F-box/FBD/LRR-repeat protein At1g13570-like n=1 Tax=Mercurialis annua TaxID=3986 RepID=UPI00215E187D|nr:F-box/FBD/LRR-repeat protein At1g13570-like [Mercurialis annua]